jgi:hypothetical protein
VSGETQKRSHVGPVVSSGASVSLWEALQLGCLQILAVASVELVKVLVLRKEIEVGGASETPAVCFA